jgi:multidrug efflux system outer membrane protein
VQLKVLAESTSLPRATPQERDLLLGLNVKLRFRLIERARPAIVSLGFPAYACAVAWTCCLLAGCAATQSIPVLQADLPARWESAADPATALPHQDLAQWWRALGDPALDDLVTRALRGNLSLAAAGQRLHAARALSVPAEGASLPNLRFATTATPTPDSRGSYFQAGFDAQWELGLFGRSAAVIGMATADAGLAQVNLRAARVSVAAEVVRTWLEWRDAERRLSLFDQEVSLQRQNLELLQTRVRSRLAAAHELAGVRAVLAQAESARLEPQGAIQRQRQQLKVLLGDRNAALPEDARAVIATPTEMRIEQTPADLLRTRPEIQRAEQQVLRAASAAGEARANLYPRLALGGMLSAAWPLHGAGPNSSMHSTLVLGPTFDIPLFDWGSRRAVVDVRDAELAAVVLEYRQSVLEGVTEVQVALASLALQRERQAGARRAHAALIEQENAALTRRRLGLADQLEIGAARSARLQAELVLSQAQLAHQLSFVALCKALGGASPDGGYGPDSAANPAAIQGSMPGATQ